MRYAIFHRHCRARPGNPWSRAAAWMPPGSSPGMTSARIRWCTTGISLRRPQLRLHLIEDVLDLGAFQPRDIVLIFKQHAKRVRHSGRIERGDIELGERAGPVQGFGDAWRLEQVLLT